MKYNGEPHLRRVRMAWITQRGIDPGNQKNHRNSLWLKTINRCMEKGIAINKQHAEDLVLEGEQTYG